MPTTSPRVEPLRVSHIPTAIQTSQHAFADDPLQNYLQKSPDARELPLQRLRLFLMESLSYLADIKSHAILTVSAGTAYISFERPGQKPNLIHRVVANLRNFFRSFRTPEQQRRIEEFFGKLERAEEEAVGDHRDQMFYISGLGTDPAYQGRGYGTALVKAVTDLADAHSYATWVSTGNAAAVPFYESCGFVAVAFFLLGEDNPTWNKEPVKFTLFVREPELPIVSEKSGRH